ncbi:Predicted transcription regulator, ArsR family [Acidilobus saccharovorans 345-15]|uniref:Predicted transcription regulator, ArsR family n=1 Tax=Acidilobus saccharovorans (strain DSM 16705 / JCM 18335 / VKM B-2471 / 345-15) TaxID=666510 RepID=D9Q362_ACIS3|nr:winged helix-turn-helix domain-containing protein [Acidilobus saccharovorans]ADL19750.1 Predicted transcription regulator, ArsR family [Acidilobus saccharovorans 345-15]
MPERGLGFRDKDHLLWWLFIGSRGGEMRLRIVELLAKGPANANQIAEALGVNYRTVRHHLELLVESGLVITEGPRYGQLYYLSKDMLESLGRVKGMVKEGSLRWR